MTPETAADLLVHTCKRTIEATGETKNMMECFAGGKPLFGALYTFDATHKQRQLMAIAGLVGSFQADTVVAVHDAWSRLMSADEEQPLGEDGERLPPTADPLAHESLNLSIYRKDGPSTLRAYPYRRTDDGRIEWLEVIEMGEDPEDKGPHAEIWRQSIGGTGRIPPALAAHALQMVVQLTRHMVVLLPRSPEVARALGATV